MQSPGTFGSLADLVNASCPSGKSGGAVPEALCPPTPPPATSTGAEEGQQGAALDSSNQPFKGRADRASSPGGLAGPLASSKASSQTNDLKTAGSLPILQSALHRRSAFAQGAGVLPPSLGVVPSFEGPFPPQALIIKDNSHRREAYAKGQGALPPPLPSSSRHLLQGLARTCSSDSDTLLESDSSAFVNGDCSDPVSAEVDLLAHKSELGRLAPTGRGMRQVESFNTDVVRQSIDKASRTDISDKHISSSGMALYSLV